MILLSNQEIKVINATARIIPGIAYPDIENVVSISSNLLLETPISIIEIKAKEINTKLDKKTNSIVLKRSCGYF